MKALFAALLTTLCLEVSAQPDSGMTASRPLEFVDLFNAKNETEPACYRIPVIVTAPNGDLIAAVDERVPSCGDLKWNEDINIVVRRSMDNGETWSPLEKVVDYPLGQSASDPSMIVDHVTGDILMFYNYMDLYRDRDVYYFKLIRSADNGKTWSAPVDITSQISRFDWKSDFKFITSGGGIQTGKGKLVHTLVNLQKGLHIFASDDHGKSWYLMETPLKPGDESKIVELADGRWMLNSRVNGLGYRYVHVSPDEGKSWQSTIDSSLCDPGCNASLIRLRSRRDGANDDLLLFANPSNKDERKNLSIRISHDDGKTWSAGETIYPGSSAYSSMTVLSNGDIGLFFEKDDYRENVFVVLPLAWIHD